MTNLMSEISVSRDFLSSQELNGYGCRMISLTLTQNPDLQRFLELLLFIECYIYFIINVMMTTGQYDKLRNYSNISN